MERLLAVWVEPLSIESPDGATWRDFARLVEALQILSPFSEAIRLGLCVIPVRGPSRFFGGEGAVLEAVAHTVRDVTGHEASLGVADGLFLAELAARSQRVVPVGASEAFRRAQPLDVLGRADLAATCARLGIRSVGAFADLAPAKVAERFSAAVVRLHRVARGEVGELAGQRDPRVTERLASVRGETQVGPRQGGFFGERTAGDERAAAAAHRVRRRLGAEGVVVAALRAGRAPEDRAVLVPFGASAEAERDEAPWPGQLRAPSPATTLARPVPVELRDANGAPLRVTSRGGLTGEPATLWFSHAIRRDVAWHAGPWPSLERWWALARSRAHLQLVLTSGEAVLLVAQSHRWWLVGIYD